jgi:hypothetical protein
MNFARLALPQRVSAISMAVVAVAAFLPWVSIFGISKIGVQGDGVITLVLAIVGMITLVMTTGVVGDRGGAPRRRSQVFLLVLAIITAILALADMNGAAAIGLYLTMFGGIAWVVGAVWELTASRSSAAAYPDRSSGPAEMQQTSDAVSE